MPPPAITFPQFKRLMNTIHNLQVRISRLEKNSSPQCGTISTTYNPIPLTKLDKYNFLTNVECGLPILSNINFNVIINGKSTNGVFSTGYQDGKYLIYFNQQYYTEEINILKIDNLFGNYFST